MSTTAPQANALAHLDKEIIYELGNNAQLSYNELAKKLKSKTTVVAYHFQKLIDNKTIWKFVPVFSLSRLGIYAYKMYFRLHGLDKQQKEKMIEELVKNPLINWVAESAGAWDLLWSTYATNMMEFAERKNVFFMKYGEYIEEYAVTLLEDALVFNRDHLVQRNIDYRKEFVFGGEKKIEVIDEDQKDIIRRIRNDGRFQITHLARDAKLNIRTVMAKIKDLEKRKIIQGYTTFVNIEKMNLKFFKLCVYTRNVNKEKYAKLLNFCRMQKNVIHLIRSIGEWDSEIEIEAEHVEQVYSFIEEIKTLCPDIIKKIDVVIITKEHKLDFFPEWY